MRPVEHYAGTPRRLRVAVAFLLAFSLVHSTWAAQFSLFRIGTAGEQGTYFPIGALLAGAFSDQQIDCPEGGACNQPGLIAVAQLSTGSVANVGAIRAGDIEAGLVQADVAYWAYTGSEAFSHDKPHANLRAIASLYPESVQLVARRDGGIHSVADLRDKRVSLDEPGSGTLEDARAILRAYDLTVSDLHPYYLKPKYAAVRLLNNEIDAFFIVSGYPTPAVERLAGKLEIRLVPITGEPALRLRRKFPFFSASLIPSQTYTGVDETPTLSVRAQLLVNANTDPDLVYKVTSALWNRRTRLILDKGHPMGRRILFDAALEGIGIPLHEGAKRYYVEKGLSEPATTANAGVRAK